MTYPFDVNLELDGIEKSLRLTSTHSFNDKRFSTGLLTVDLILNGGIVPGAWYTFFGPEQSAKSTLAMTVLAALSKTSVPIVALVDFEGSYQPDYFFNICQQQGIKNPKALFGIPHAKGKGYIEQPRIRYYSMGIGDHFFDFLAKLERQLPDKLKEGDSYWYVFDNTKENRKKLGDTKYDKALYSKTGRLYVPAEDAAPQAIIIVDSYPAMMPEAMDVDDPSEAMAVQARMFSKNLPRVKGKMKNKMITVIGINQLRLNPGARFGDPHYEPGGEALKFMSDARIKCSPRANPYASGPFETEASVLNDNEDVYRYVVHQAIKNKLGTPQLENWARLWINDGAGNAWGFDPVYDVFQFLTCAGFITGTRKKMVLSCPFWKISDLSLKWEQLKLWVLGDKEHVTELCKKLGVKPFPMRKACAQLMEEHRETIFENWFKGQAEEDEEEEEEEE